MKKKIRAPLRQWNNNINKLLHNNTPNERFKWITFDRNRSVDHLLNGKTSNIVLKSNINKNETKLNTAIDSSGKMFVKSELNDITEFLIS